MASDDYIKRWYNSLQNDSTIDRLKTIANVIQYPEVMQALSEEEKESWMEINKLCFENHMDEIQILWSMQEIRPSHLFNAIKQYDLGQAIQVNMESALEELTKFWVKYLLPTANKQQKWYMAAIGMRQRFDYSDTNFDLIVNLINEASKNEELKTIRSEPIRYIVENIEHIIHTVNDFDIDALFSKKVTAICHNIGVNATHDRRTASVTIETQRVLEPIFQKLIKAYEKIHNTLPGLKTKHQDIEAWFKEQSEKGSLWTKNMAMLLEASNIPGFTSILHLQDKIDAQTIYATWLQLKEVSHAIEEPLPNTISTEP